MESVLFIIPFSRTALLIACVQVSVDYCARIIFPADGARGSVSQPSMRGDPIPQHQRACHDWVFVHAWKEPGWKNGKEPKIPSEGNTTKCLSAEPDAAWRTERTGFLPDSTMERRNIDVSQSVLTREYFRTANSVEIHHEHRHGLSGIERTWRTKGCNQRVLQMVMEKVLVNRLLSFKFYTGQSPSIRDFTNVVAQVLCADEEEEAVFVAVDRTRAQTQSRISKSAVATPWERINHALVKGKSIGAGGKREQGPYNMRKERLANRVCITCAKGLDTDSAEQYWLCSTGPHGRQCYCQHLHEMLHPRK